MSSSSTTRSPCAPCSSEADLSRERTPIDVVDVAADVAADVVTDACEPIGIEAVRTGPTAQRRRRTPMRIAMEIAILVVCVVGVVVRAWPRGALWLDEAQSVAIARLPWTRTVGALREDGAPPLYYVLLHVWMDVFGTGDAAVRSLTLLTSIAFVAAIVVAARRFAGIRAGWCVLVLVASSSFAVRYASETRMYSLVMLEATLLLLAVSAMLDRPTLRRGVITAVLVASLAYTHYWGIYLIAATGGTLLIGVCRVADPGRRRAVRLTLTAVVAGALLWAPWLPVFRYQSQRTATPWTERGDLVDIVDTTFRWNRTELAGGLLLMVVGAGIIAALLFGRREWRAARLPRWAIALAALGALVLAAVGGSLSGSAYVGRYTSIAFPVAVLMAGVGIASLRPRRLAVFVLVPVWALGVGYTIDEIRTPRTRATPIADALLAHIRPGDVVVYCPDQLGPATSRLLDRSTAMRNTTQLVYPGGAPPERVDWVDYAGRYRAAVPAPFASAVSARAAGGSVWLIVSTTYPATQQACLNLTNSLRRVRPDATRLVADEPLIADHGALWRFDPSPTAS